MAATDPMAMPVEREDDNDFPWGLLGLLGLAGLIPRKRTTDNDNRSDRVNR
jgi:MYXO-CTERM domain-containing protein